MSASAGESRQMERSVTFVIMMRRNVDLTAAGAAFQRRPRDHPETPRPPNPAQALPAAGACLR